MSDKKRRSLNEWFEDLEQRFKNADSKLEHKLKNADKKMEAAADRFEKRLDEAGKSVEASMERLGQRIEGKFTQLDQWFEKTGHKLEVILEGDGIKKHYQDSHTQSDDTHHTVKAVDGVDINLIRGETLGIVGESGCGKSTIARIMIGLIPPTDGGMRLFGRDIAACTKAERKEIRRRTGIVFQDPYGSLDPRMNVAEIVGEPLRAYKLYPNKKDRLLHTLEILEACGLSESDMFKFPHQFSGGQRQRICIARALVADPDIIVCDEAVSSLDVSIQAQIMNLLCDLRDERGLTYIFISHDIDIVRFIADRIAVMYMGKIVELATKEKLFENPCHPYTTALLNSAPVFGRRAVDNAEDGKPDTILPEESIPQTGCKYRPRCKYAMPQCEVLEPPLRMTAEGHAVACYRFTKDQEEYSNE